MIKLSSGLNIMSDEFRSECLEALECILPDGFQYMVNDFTLIEKSKIVGEAKIKTKFRVNVTNKDDIDGFIKNLGDKSGTSYNTYCGDAKGTGKKVVIRGYRKCMHKVIRHHLTKNEPHKGPGRQPGAECVPGKNTACPAKIKFTLSGSKHHTSKRYKLSLTRKHKDEYPLEIELDFTHNHSINSADALRYRPVSEEVKSKFVDLFSQEFTPAAALTKYKDDLKLLHGEDDITYIMADRSKVPDYFWVFHFYANYIEQKYGKINGIDAYLKAVERVKEYNERHGLEVAKIAQTEQGETIVAICDMFSRRIHEYLPQAGDIVLVDATSNLDRQDTKLFHLVCPSPVGGLPLGTIITSREDEITVKAGFHLYKSLLPEKAFFGRGELGPKIIMTDDSQAEQNALISTWGNIVLLLCIFHLLQALWRWEWNSDNKIDKVDRPTIFNLFKALVYAKTDEEYINVEKELFENATVVKYPQFIQHVKKDILPRKDEWAISSRIQRNLWTHNVNTTNYVEISFRLTKDNQFSRVKAYNLPDLLDIVLDDSKYYVSRCLDVSNNRVSQLKNQKSRYLAKKCKIDPRKIVVLDNNCYLVPSERIAGKMYEVNMDLALCQCPEGMLRGPCKHKQVVTDHFNLISSDIIPDKDPRVRAFYHFLATGKSKEASWFRPLNEANEAAGVESACTNDIFSFMRERNSSPNPSNSADKIVEETEISNEVETQNVYGGNEIDMEIDNEDEEVIEEFENAISDFKEEVIRRFYEDSESYSKCVKSFTNQLGSINTSSHSVFQSALFKFMDVNTLPTRKGRRKTARNIPIQKASKSRRLYQFRGSQNARKGRPRKDVVKPKSLEVTYHCLPKQKKQKSKNPHSISTSVKANRAAEKKH